MVARELSCNFHPAPAASRRSRVGRRAWRARSAWRNEPQRPRTLGHEGHEVHEGFAFLLRDLRDLRG